MAQPPAHVTPAGPGPALRPQSPHALRSAPASVFAARTAAPSGPGPGSPGRRPLPLAPSGHAPGSPSSARASPLPAADTAPPHPRQKDGPQRCALRDAPPSAVDDQQVSRYALDDQPLALAHSLPLFSPGSHSAPNAHDPPPAAGWSMHPDNASETTIGTVSTADADVTGRIRTPAAQLAGKWKTFWGGPVAQQVPGAGQTEGPQQEGPLSSIHDPTEPLRRLDRDLGSEKEPRIAHTPESPVRAQMSPGLRYVKSQRVVKDVADRSQWEEQDDSDQPEEDDEEADDIQQEQKVHAHQAPFLAGHRNVFGPYPPHAQRQSTPPPFASRTSSTSQGGQTPGPPGTPNQPYRATTPMVHRPDDGQAMRNLTPVPPSPGRVVSSETKSTAHPLPPPSAQVPAGSRSVPATHSAALGAASTTPRQGMHQSSGLTPGSGPLPSITGWNDPGLPQALDNMMARFYRFERYAVPLLRELKLRIIDVEKDAQMSFAAAARRRHEASTVRSEASGTSVSTTGSTEMDMWVEQMTRLMKHEIGQLGRASDELTGARCALEDLRLSHNQAYQKEEAALPFPQSHANVEPSNVRPSDSSSQQEAPMKGDFTMAPSSYKQQVDEEDRPRHPSSASSANPANSVPARSAGPGSGVVSVSPSGRPRFTSALGAPPGTPVLSSVPLCGTPTPTTPTTGHRVNYPSRTAISQAQRQPRQDAPAPTSLHKDSRESRPPPEESTPRGDAMQLRPPTPEEEEDQSASALLRTALAEARTLSQLEVEASLMRNQAKVEPECQAASGEGDGPDLSFSLAALTDAASEYSQRSAAHTESGTEGGTNVATQGHSVPASSTHGPPSWDSHQDRAYSRAGTSTSKATQGHSDPGGCNMNRRTSLQSSVFEGMDDWSIEADLAEELGVPPRSPGHQPDPQPPSRPNLHRGHEPRAQRPLGDCMSAEPRSPPSPSGKGESWTRPAPPRRQARSPGIAPEGGAVSDVGPQPGLGRTVASTSPLNLGKKPSGSQQNRAAQPTGTKFGRALPGMQPGGEGEDAGAGGVPALRPTAQIPRTGWRVALAQQAPPPTTSQPTTPSGPKVSSTDTSPGIRSPGHPLSPHPTPHAQQRPQHRQPSPSMISTPPASHQPAPGLRRTPLGPTQPSSQLHARSPGASSPLPEKKLPGSSLAARVAFFEQRRD